MVVNGQAVMNDIAYRATQLVLRPAVAEDSDVHCDSLEKNYQAIMSIGFHSPKKQTSKPRRAHSRTHRPGDSGSRRPITFFASLGSRKHVARRLPTTRPCRSAGKLNVALLKPITYCRPISGGLSSRESMSDSVALPASKSRRT